MNCFQKFDDSSPSLNTWPLSSKSVSEFITWAAVKQNLKAKTVKSYLGSLRFIHKLNNMPCENCSGFIPDTILKGIENLEFYMSIMKESKKAMSLPLLKLLGHEIAGADWTPVNKAVVWSACTTAFFGSLRMGEILAKSPSSFNPGETLLWSDVSVKKDSIMIHVKIPKNRNKKGEFVDIFEFKGHNCCPVSAIKNLYKLKGSAGLDHLPVFSLQNGRLLTPVYFGNLIQTLLAPHLGSSATLLCGHSFRAAIPSVLSNSPSLAADTEIKLWGRWSSSSYKLYTRLELERRRAIFFKIASALHRNAQ